MRCIRFFSWVEVLQNSESAVNLVRRANKSCKLTKVTVAKCMTSLGGLDLEQDMPPHQPRDPSRLDGRCKDGSEWIPPC